MALKETLLNVAKEGLSEYSPVVSKPIKEVKTAKTAKMPKTAEEAKDIEPEIKVTSKEAPVEKKMPGRPAKDPTTKKTVYISDENMLNIKAPLLMNNGNLSQYINNLIEKDIKDNKDLYDQMISLTSRR